MKKVKQKKCKECSEMFTPFRSTQIVCSPICSIKYSKALNDKKDAKEWSKRKSELKKKDKGTKDYYQDALKIFNEYIRKRDKDKPCVSCGAKAGTYRISSGHYFPQGQNKSIALDERNAHGQCWYNCNSQKSGNLSEYYPELINRIGIDNYNDLVEKKKIAKHYTIDELLEIINYYKNKLKTIAQ